MLRNNKPGEQEEIIEPVAGTLCSHVTRGGSRNIVGGGGGSMSFMYMYLGLQNQWQAGCIVMSSRMDLGYGSSELRLVGFIVGGWGSCAFYLSGIMDLDILLGEGAMLRPIYIPVQVLETTELPAGTYRLYCHVISSG